MAVIVNDTVFISAFQNGQPETFKALYHHFVESLTYFVDEVVKQPAVAEDICIETLTKAFQTHANFASLQKLKAFLYITAKNAALDYVREEKRHGRIQANLVYLTTTAEKDAELAYIKAEASQAVREAIETLPPQPKRVIQLAFIEGKKLVEVAKELGLSYNTVQNHRARGLELMRAYLLRTYGSSPALLCMALAYLHQ